MKTISKMIKTCVLIALCAIPAFPLQAKTIKIATVSPEGTYWMKQMRAGAKEIKELTKGRVKFKFYPGGVMGSDENVLRKIRIGQLHGGAITIGNLAQSTPDVTIYGLPFLFASLEDAEAVRKTSDPMLSKMVELNGFVNFGFAQGGFTYLMSKQPIKSFDDLRQQKSWIPDKSDVGLAVYDYIGVTPIPLAYSDVLTGLQTGLIDNVITSPIGALALQWHTHIRYVVDLPLNYLTATMVIDKKAFSKLSETDQAVVRRVMDQVYRNIDQQNMIDNIAAREALVNQGVKFITLTDEEKKRWLEAGDFVIHKMIDKYHYDEALYKAVTSKKPNAPVLH